MPVFEKADESAMQLYDFEGKYSKEVADMINTGRWKERLFTNPQYHVTPSSLESYIRDMRKKSRGYWMLVAVSKGKIIGYLDFDVSKKGEGLMRAIYLKPKYRKGARGRIMLSEAERILKNNNCFTLYGHIFEDNAGAIRFLERQGYLYQRAEKHKEREKKYIIMKKMIVY